MSDVTYQTAFALARQLLADVRALITQVSGLKSDATAAAVTVSAQSASASASAASATAAMAQVKAYLASLSIRYQWLGTKLRLLNPDGTWGPYVDLVGPQGPAGSPVSVNGHTGLTITLSADDLRLATVATTGSITDLDTQFLQQSVPTGHRKLYIDPNGFLKITG